MSNQNWLSSIFSGDTSDGDAISASTLNVTKIVSIFGAIFAGVTQVLTSSGVVGLSTSQMITIWLTVAGFIVLLSIADMICRAYVTGKSYGVGEASVANLKISVKVQGPDKRWHEDANLLSILTGGSKPLAHVEWKNGNGKVDGWVPLDAVTLP